MLNRLLLSWRRFMGISWARWQISPPVMRWRLPPCTSWARVC